MLRPLTFCRPQEIGTKSFGIIPLEHILSRIFATLTTCCVPTVIFTGSFGIASHKLPVDLMGNVDTVKLTATSGGDIEGSGTVKGNILELIAGGGIGKLAALKTDVNNVPGALNLTSSGAGALGGAGGG